MVRFKEQAIERLSEAGVFTTLTMTAALGVNDYEIGAVVRRCLDTPYVSGVSVQPVFGSGRSAGIDPMDRLTHTGVLARLGPLAAAGDEAGLRVAMLAAARAVKELQ